MYVNSASAAQPTECHYTGCQTTLTYHVNIISKIQNGFLTCPEFFPSTSHHNFVLHLTFPFALVITDKFIFKNPKSNAESEDSFLQTTAYCFEIFVFNFRNNFNNSYIVHNKSIQKDKFKKNTCTFILIWKNSHISVIRKQTTNTHHL